MNLFVLGISYHETPIEIRERVTYQSRSLPNALSQISLLPGLLECAILSTCNRTEVYGTVEGQTREATAQLLIRHLSAFHNVSEPLLAHHVYCKWDEDAARHLLRVACGLNSQVLGEAQILGQVKSALGNCIRAQTGGPVVSALFQKAIDSARRAQSETGIGRGAFSIGHAAVDLASHIFADLSGAKVMILGAGKMSEITARHLQANGVVVVVVANRTFERAEALALKLGGRAIRYEAFMEELVTSDIVISSTAAPHHILNRSSLAPVMKRRRGRPLFLIDIAVPRDMDPDVTTLPDVVLYNIDDLQSVLATERSARTGDVELAEGIAVSGADEFLIWLKEREAAPLFVQMRNHFDHVLAKRLTILKRRIPSTTEHEWEIIEAQFRALLEEVARTPILRVKKEMGGTHSTMPSDDARYTLIEAAREIFGLNGLPGANDDVPKPTAPECAAEKTPQ